jgi:hypothetical protein
VLWNHRTKQKGRGEGVIGILQHLIDETASARAIGIVEDDVEPGSAGLGHVAPVVDRIADDEIRYKSVLSLDDLPRKADNDCLQELCWLYARRNLAEAKHDLVARDPGPTS